MDKDTYLQNRLFYNDSVTKHRFNFLRNQMKNITFGKVLDGLGIGPTKIQLNRYKYKQGIVNSLFKVLFIYCCIYTSLEAATYKV